MQGWGKARVLPEPGTFENLHLKMDAFGLGEEAAHPHVLDEAGKGDAVAAWGLEESVVD